ncbi:MAG TPA: hypothetical protein VE439_01255 [Anaerolineae bacterium]|jgi:hypothetical protein|nr:hypothetical protein [Anaerolineae bacterium]
MMGEINNLSLALDERFGGQVRVAPYNIFYDDTGDIRELIDRVLWEGITLPAVFIDGDLELEGYIDEPTLSQLLRNRGLEEISIKGI